MLGKWSVSVGVRWLWVGGFRCHMCRSYRNLWGELSRRCVFSYLRIVISCWMGREMVTEITPLSFMTRVKNIDKTAKMDQNENMIF